jgi:uncharacterized protein (DUF4213/DUF364 family)
MISPTTLLSPLRFNHGIDVICGTKVIDSERLIRFIGEGTAFKEVSGVKLLTLTKT